MARRRFIAATLVLGAALRPAVAEAANGPHPATSTPAALWGELEPVDLPGPPAERDHSGFDEFTQFYYTAHLFAAPCARGSRLFVAENWGLSIWDLSNPASPALTGRFDYDTVGSGWGQKATGEGAKMPVVDLALPPDTGDVALLAAASAPMGIAIVKTASKVPFVIYQDAGPNKTSSATYAAAIQGRHYGFSVDGSNALRVYDLDQASALTLRCVEDAPAPSSACPKVFLGSAFQTTFVNPKTGKPQDKQLQAAAGVDQLVVTGGVVGFDLWDASQPTKPIHLASGESLAAVPLATAWKHGGRTLVATVIGPSFADPSVSWNLSVYDVTDLVAGKTTSFAKLSSVPLPAAPAVAVAQLETSLGAGGTPFVSYASGGLFSPSPTAIGIRAEALWDVSEPSKPRDVTPPAQQLDGGLVDYWGWSYQFGWAGPRGAVVAGEHVYRAATSLLEVHRWKVPVQDGGSADASSGGTSADASTGGAGGVGGIGGVGGVAPAGGAGGTPAASGDDGGCGCRAAGGRSFAAWSGLAALVIIALGRLGSSLRRR